MDSDKELKMGGRVLCRAGPGDPRLVMAFVPLGCLWGGVGSARAEDRTQTPKTQYWGPETRMGGGGMEVGRG